MIHSARYTVPASSDNYLKAVLFSAILKSTEGKTEVHTDTKCGNSDHYRP